MTNEQLVALIKQGKDINQNMERLFKQNEGIIRLYALRYLNRYNEMEDLIQMAYIGLAKAVERFNPDLGYKFTTSAIWDIRQAMQRNRDKTPTDTASLNQSVFVEKGESDIFYIDLIIDENAENADITLSNDELNQTVRAAIDRLPPLYKRVIVHRYYRNKSHKAIAHTLRKSQQSISQIEAKALFLLRTDSELKRLLDIPAYQI